MTATEALVTVITSAATTLAVLAVQAWRYRPRPIDPKTLEDTMRRAMRAAQGR